MTWYLKKNWKKVSLACAAILISEAVLVLAQLVMMQSFDAAVHLDARRFLVWTAGLGGVYLATCAMTSASPSSPRPTPTTTAGTPGNTSPG